MLNSKIIIDKTDFEEIEKHLYRSKRLKNIYLKEKEHSEDGSNWVYIDFYVSVDFGKTWVFIGDTQEDAVEWYTGRVTEIEVTFFYNWS